MGILLCITGPQNAALRAVCVLCQVADANSSLSCKTKSLIQIFGQKVGSRLWAAPASGGSGWSKVPGVAGA